MKKRFAKTRRAGHARVALLLTVLVITVTILFNAVFGKLADRYEWYGAMVPTSLTYDVSRACYDLLDDVFESAEDAEVEIIFCDLAENIKADSSLNYVFETANELALHYSDHVSVSCRDILTDPTSVKQYMSATNPATGESEETPIYTTSVIIVADGYHRVYELTEFFVFKDNNTSNVWAYNGEKKLASGILKAVDPDLPIVCLIENHGETYYDYELLYALDDAGYAIGYIDLYRDEIPKGCKMLISYNPSSDLVADEVSKVSETAILNEFLSEDGNAFLAFVDVSTPMLPSYEAYLEEWGVVLNKYTDSATGKVYRHILQDEANSLTSDGYTISGTRTDGAKANELLGDLGRAPIFKNATSISAANGFVSGGDGSYTKGDRTLYSLYEGGAAALAWASGRPVGEAGMMMTLTEQAAGESTSYVGVFSSARFATEAFMQSAVHGNTDVMLRLLSMIGERTTPEGLPIRPFQSTAISSITMSEMLSWTLVLTLVPAAAVSLTAITALLRRRRA